MRTAALHAALLSLLLGLPTPCALAQSSRDDGWNPFKVWPERPPAERRAPPGEDPRPPDRVNVQREPPSAPRSRPVESSELAPVMAPDASGLPLELWRGLDLKGLEQLLAGLDLPPRSPALHGLWRRMLLSSAGPPQGTPSDDHFAALRLEALYRSGLLEDMAEVADKGGAPGLLVQALRARRDIGLGARDAGCDAIKALAAPRSGLPGRLKGETQLLAGYCAAAVGDAAAAGLAAELAREEGIEADVPLAVLAALASGSKPRLHLPKRVLLLDYRFLELMGPVDAAHVLDKAEPALLVALAAGAGDLRVQTAAAEAALRLHAMSSDAVADIYRRQPEPAPGSAALQGERVDPALRRGRLLRAIEYTQVPDLKSRLVRALLDDARRVGLYVPTARMLAPAVSQLWPGPETAGMAEAITEIALAVGDFILARRWAETSANLRHWLALVDIADPERRDGRPATLVFVEELAGRGRLSADMLHRLATVLDALDLDVPMGLWEAAGRAPQPAGGHLPATGVLADLAQSSQRKDTGRTILLAMLTLGAGGADGANILALGDTIRALKRVGLEADARRLALEALFVAWPRTAGH